MLEKKPAYYAEEARVCMDPASLCGCVHRTTLLRGLQYKHSAVAGRLASRGPHLGYSAANVRHLLWTFGKWDFPHVTHFRFFGWVLGRFPEIVYPVNVQYWSGRL